MADKELSEKELAAFEKNLKAQRKKIDDDLKAAKAAMADLKKVGEEAKEMEE